MQYLVSVIDDMPGHATPDEMAAISAFNKRIKAEGHWVFAGGLAAPDSATVITTKPRPATSWIAQCLRYWAVMGLESTDLDRLNDLCADLTSTVGDGQLLAWANVCEPAEVPDVVFGVISNLGLLTDGSPATGSSAPGPGRRVTSVPADADALWSRLWEVDEPTAIGLLATLAASGQRGRPGRGRLLRRYQEQLRDVIRELAHLTGPGTRWWTNTDLTSWNAITQRTFDAVVVCAGNGIAVTLVASAGDG